ncbi:Nrap protein [Trichoderma ceciliae]
MPGDAMESSSKRRKIDHESIGLRHAGLIDFESRNTARVTAASTFVLQTDELLKEAKPNYEKALHGVDGQLHRLKSIIDSIEPHNPKLISDATATFEKEHRIVIPYPDPKPAKDAPYKVSYTPPSQCNVVGSYVSRTMIKTQSEFSIDMVVQMPTAMFQEKDYTNMRYFYRRAYYIAYIAAHVRNELAQHMDLSFENLNENPLLPIVVLRPKASSDGGDDREAKKKAKTALYNIKLIPCAPDDLFPWSKVTPKSNNNRLGEVDEKKGVQAATPFYNSTLNAERTFIPYLRLLTHIKKECPAFPDACILGRTWLQQRGFSSAISQGGFGHFEWAAMIALLLQTGGRNGKAALSASLSSTELFKAALQFLSTTDFGKKPYTFGSSNISADAVREPGPVMFDPVRQLNLLFKMTPWSASLLQMYAKSTTDLLADAMADKFDPTFIVKADIPFQTFDVIFEIQSSGLAKFSESADNRGTVGSFCLEAHKHLKRAYGDRAQLVQFQLPPGGHWSLAKPPAKESMRALIGVIFDPAHMSRQMEFGPPAEEQKEAARFRHFWGDKAELRRFKDGSILECVEWSSKLPLQICEEITHYILKRHLKIAKEQVTTIGGAFSSIISLSHMDKAAFDSARQAFQNFERDIRNLEELPLHIRQLSPTSSSARYASIEPPLMGYHKGSIELMDVNLYFEASSKWPENLTAIQEAKVEFLLDIDRRLTKANDKITTYLGRENKELGIENLAYLDIIYENGAAFRLRIHCDLEEKLLERQVKNKTLEPRVRDAAEEAFARLNWLYNTLPLHTQTIATFCTRFPPLSQTIRVVKHWFNSHRLSGHIREELIELFVLHAFLQPYPWKQPSSVITGLLRTLFFLSRWDWRDDALIVDTAEDLSEDDRSSVRHELQTWRKRDPSMNDKVMYVATSHDQSGLAYTRNGPSKLVASRMTHLAKAACKLVREKGIHLDPSLLFEAALQDYDVLIHLSPKAVKNIIRETAVESGGRKHSQFKNLDALTASVPLPIRAHPTDVFIQELERVYEDTLLFFRGSADDGVVAALWNPRLQKQKFRAGLPYNFHSREGDGDQVEVNRAAVLLEIARAGGDVIKKIEVADE